MRLWVDDERPAPEGWAWVESSAEAIRVLDTEHVESLSLDYCLKGSDTGDMVLFWLKDNLRAWPVDIFAHSSSSSGSALLERLIKDYAPVIIESPEELDALPPGKHIIDGGYLHAVKTDSGAWLYDDGEHWEPEMFPCKVVG